MREVTLAPKTPRRDVKPSWSGVGGGGPGQAEFLLPGDDGFDELLRTTYSGFVVDGKEQTPEKEHRDMERTFKALDAAGIFQTDVTQPFGLGSKCAKTFVSRTLVGEPGATYKYLGLRMFAHPWTPGIASGPAADALLAVGRLSERLQRRSAAHLAALGAARAAAGSDARTGSCKFTLTLINRMEPAAARPDLKFEPFFKRDKCSVSWHADSCLEHFSTIAVYHLTDAAPAADGDWRVALRVEHDAEGPTAGKLKQPGGKAAAAASKAKPPAVAVPLPSGASYYLLDDFNHHHQHAVLAGRSIRYASTHRVAKQEGHTFKYVAQRCAVVLGTANSHKRSLKQWRAEQALLTEIETEWIRQFYVQGRRHYDLHEWWHEPLRQLTAWWLQLEQRTLAMLATLRGAAEAALADREGRAGVAAGNAARSKEEKRTEQTRRKHAAAMASLGNKAAQAYLDLAVALVERSTKREGWRQREQDAAFSRMPADCRPMLCPLFTPAASSPLPQDVRPVAIEVRAWQRTFLNERGIVLLPTPPYLVAAAASTAPSEACAAAKNASVVGGAAVTAASANGGSKIGGGEAPAAAAGERAADPAKSVAASAGPAATGIGATAAAAAAAAASDGSHIRWDTMPAVGLELQSPWAEKLLLGEKTVETRAYPLPAGLLGRRLAVLQSIAGRDGVSAVGDRVPAASAGIVVAGWVVFASCAAYKSEAAWAADRKRHLVPRDSPYGWPKGRGAADGKGGVGGVVYGWVVGSCGRLETPRPVPAMRRVLRSLFRLKLKRASGKELKSMLAEGEYADAGAARTVVGAARNFDSTAVIEESRQGTSKAEHNLIGGSGGDYAGDRKRPRGVGFPSKGLGRGSGVGVKVSAPKVQKQGRPQKKQKR